ncbi:hypothetical protein RQP46_002537 [Phenoliferia psychrophenolica]
MAHATFSSLPLELKARVVEMASDQEDAYKERVKDPDERTGHINGLSTLALVNKELRDLAAKHQFKMVTSPSTSSSIFRFRILPRYGQHITEVRLHNSQSMEGAAYALSILGQLPALRDLRISIDAATRLFGPGVTLGDDVEDEDQCNRASILELVAPRIQILVLDRFKPSEAVGLVRTFSSNLRALGLTDLQGGDTSGLFSAIASARQLDNLSIHVEDVNADDWPSPEARAPLARDPPPIKTLQLLGFAFDRTTLHLIGLFAPTIETLTVLAVASTSPADAASSTHPHLPHLANLNLSIHGTDLESLIRLLSPSLTVYHFSLLCYGGVDPENPTLLPFLDTQPTLRYLHLNEIRARFPYNCTREPPPAPSSLVAYADLVHSRGLDPSVLDRPHLTPFHPDAKMDYTRAEQPFLSQSLRRTLEFGLVQLDRMDAEGDVAKAVGWVPKLKALEEERLAWKD